VLAAVVLSAVAGLINFPELLRMWRVSRLDFQAAAIALVTVLLLGILQGILLAALASVVLLLIRASRPHVAFLGRIPGTRRFSDLERHPDNERVRGVLIFRVESSLFYFNAEHVHDSVIAKLNASPEPIRLVLCDLSNAPHVDLAGAEMLHELQRELAASDIGFRIVEARSSVRDFLRIEGLEEKVGRIGRTRSVADVLDDFQHGAAAAAPECSRTGLTAAVQPAHARP
jgi:MFS superfamily sulfate permease-like transporter